jgi:hypothetical protein
MDDYITEDLAIGTKGKFVKVDVVIDQSNILGKFMIFSDLQELFLGDMYIYEGGHLFFRHSFGARPFVEHLSKQATKCFRVRNGRGRSWHNGNCSAGQGFS